MTTHPLLTHSLDQTVALYQGRPISASEFLADVEYLAGTLPAGKHLLNVCSDRYHFAVGLAAAIVTGKVSLLPPTNTPEMVRRLKYFLLMIQLHASEHCDIDLLK